MGEMISARRARQETSAARRPAILDRSVIVQPDREPAPSPPSRLPFESPRARLSATSARPSRGQIPPLELVPVAPYNRLATAVATGGVALGVVDVAGIDVAQAVAHRDSPSAGQGRRRRRGHVHHLEVRMKRREVKRHARAEAPCRPTSSARRARDRSRCGQGSAAS